MADISMCMGGDCPLKQRCYRFTAESDGSEQTYFVTVPWDPTAENCRFYWPLDPDDRESP